MKYFAIALFFLSCATHEERVAQVNVANQIRLSVEAFAKSHDLPSYGCWGSQPTSAYCVATTSTGLVVSFSCDVNGCE